MIEFMLKGIFNAISGGIEKVMGMIMEAFSVNLDDFNTMFPAISDLAGIMEAIGWALLLIIFTVAVIASIVRPNSANAEHPALIAARSCVALFVIINTEKIIEAFFKFGMVIYEAMRTAPINNPAFDYSSMGDKLTGAGLAAGIYEGANAGAASVLVMLILLIAICFQLVKLILEIMGRYVTVCIGAYLSPLVIPTIGSKATASIATSYFSFMAGQMILMWLSVWFIRVITSGFASFGATGDQFFFHYFILYTVIVFAQKADNILSRIGFKNILGGGGTGAALIGGAALMGHAASRVIGSLMRGMRGGKSGAAPGGANKPNEIKGDSPQIGKYGNNGPKSPTGTSSVAPERKTAANTTKTTVQSQQQTKAHMDAAQASRAQAEEYRKASEGARDTLRESGSMSARDTTLAQAYASGCDHLATASDYNARYNAAIVAGDYEVATAYQSQAAGEIQEAARDFYTAGGAPEGSGLVVDSGNGAFSYTSPADPGFSASGVISPAPDSGPLPGPASSLGSITGNGGVQTAAKSAPAVAPAPSATTPAPVTPPASSTPNLTQTIGVQYHAPGGASSGQAGRAPAAPAIPAAPSPPSPSTQQTILPREAPAPRSQSASTPASPPSPVQRPHQSAPPRAPEAPLPAATGGNVLQQMTQPPSRKPMGNNRGRGGKRKK